MLRGFHKILVVPVGDKTFPKFQESFRKNIISPGKGCFSAIYLLSDLSMAEIMVSKPLTGLPFLGET